MKLRRIFAALAAAAALALPFGMTAAAAELPDAVSGSQAPQETTATVYVTIASGRLLLAQEPVEVTDCDGDGLLTVDDALYCAHDDHFEGGAAAGYDSETTAYGLSLTKLWGIAGAGYGYYVNNAGALSLSDPVADGDRVNAFVYTDAETWSDQYSFFSTDRAVVESGDPLELTLCAVSYDADFNPVALPVAGAAILIDGEDSGFATDAEGHVSLELPRRSGEHVISAVSGTQRLVPPVCVAEVTGAIPPAVFYAVFGAIGVSLIAFAVVSIVRARRSRPDDDYIY